MWKKRCVLIENNDKNILFYRNVIHFIKMTEYIWNENILADRLI